MTLKKLGELYDTSKTSFWRCRRSIMRKLNQMATYYTFQGRKHRMRRLNTRQIDLIVKKMGGPPDGYRCVKGRLIKSLNDE